MGLIGVGKGILKTVAGVISGDGEEIVRGVKKILVNIVTTVVSTISGNKDEAISSDDDE